MRSGTCRTMLISLVATSVCCTVLRAQPTESHRARADVMIEKAIAYLLAEQDESGGWRVNPTGPDMPAVTGLVVTGMVLGGALDEDDEDFHRAIDRAAAYMLSFQQPDGGIYDQLLPSYNTAICLSALAKLARPGDEAVRLMAQRFVRSLQYSEVANPEAGGGTVARVGPRHPFYGGVGYGSHGRPDNSNLHFALQALHDSGVPADDPAFQRALIFLQRTQMVDDFNDMPYADGSSQGGFIYSTSQDEEHIGEGESKAGTIEETLDDGTVVSRLRAYGSMTYAGFKSYAYAELSPSDPRSGPTISVIEAAPLGSYPAPETSASTTDDRSDAAIASAISAADPIARLHARPHCLPDSIATRLSRSNLVGLGSTTDRVTSKGLHSAAPAWLSPSISTSSRGPLGTPEKTTRLGVGSGCNTTSSISSLIAHTPFPTRSVPTIRARAILPLPSRISRKSPS